ncbi:MAG: DUF2997 domain-containing protein [Pirellulales bacterium]|nr:DUF2997 domain-containing protein [Pirellulales bacterium]
MTHIIEILVSADGQSRLQTRGFAGESCQEASRFLEAALGQVASENKTAEFYLPAPARARLEEQAG